MDTKAILKIIAYNYPGVLDKIAGLIRRKGWNISSLTAGDAGNGFSQISISLQQGRDVDVQVLGVHLTELDVVHEWVECRKESHVIREMAMFRIHEGQDAMIQVEGVRIVKKRGCVLFAEFTGTPCEVDQIIHLMGKNLLSYVRTGPLVLNLKEEEL